MAGDWNIDFHDADPAKQKEGDIVLATFKLLSGLQMNCFRTAWFGDKQPKSNDPDVIDAAINAALGDDIFKK